MKRELTRKEVYSIVIMLISFILTTLILSDWDHFKAGLLGL